MHRISSLSTSPFFVKYVDEFFMAAVWACCFAFLFEPMFGARPTEVPSTAFSEMGITKNFGADAAVELLRYWLGEVQVIATILSLGRDICYSHCDLEYC